MMDTRVLGFFTVLLIAISGYSYYALGAIDEGYFSIENGMAKTTDNVPISYLAYVPCGSGPFPAVIIGHGIAVSKEIMDGFARELARAGFLVYSFDHRGHGHSGGSLSTDRGTLELDVAAVREEMRTDPRVKQGAYGLVGYSMGGGAGYRVAEDDPELAAFVGIAPAIDAAYAYPQSMLVIVGAYDELFSPNSYRKLLSARSGIAPQEIESGTTYYTEELATRLWVSQTSDHLTIAYSAAAHEQCAAWMSVWLGGEDVDVHTAERNLYSLIGLLSGLLAVFCLIMLLPFVSSDHSARQRQGGSLIRDVGISLAYAPLTAIIVLPTIVFGLPMTTTVYLALLSIGALPAWRALRRMHPGLSWKGRLSLLYKADASAYVLAIAAGIALYALAYIFLGERYLGVVPALARLPAALCVGVILSLALTFDAWAYWRSHEALRSAAAYVSSRMLAITILVFAISAVSRNGFFLIALYVGLPLIALEAAFMMMLLKKTGSFGAAATASALFLAPILVAVSPHISLI